MKVMGTTRLAGIMGYPVEHTLSPVMHNAAYEALGLEMVYAPLLVKQEDLGKAVQGLRAFNFVGVNVTIPHKGAIMEFLDELDTTAREVGAVNTVVKRNGKLVGYNTDGAGFLLSLRKDGRFEPENKKVVLVGAGGAAAAIALSLAEAGVRRLVIANRTKARAEILAKRVRRFYQRDVLPMVLDDSRALFWQIREADLLINATSVGMKPGEHLKVNAHALHKKLFVHDIIYWETPLLKTARRRGAPAIDGLGMLVSQGARSFELLTGKRAPFRVMKTAVEQALKARTK